MTIVDWTGKVALANHLGHHWMIRNEPNHGSVGVQFPRAVAVFPEWGGGEGGELGLRRIPALLSPHPHHSLSSPLIVSLFSRCWSHFSTAVTVDQEAAV